MFWRKVQGLQTFVGCLLLTLCASFIITTTAIPPLAQNNLVRTGSASQPLATGTTIPQPVTPQRLRYQETFASTRYKHLATNIDWNPSQQTLSLAQRDQIQQQETVIAGTPTNDVIYVIWRDMRNDEGDIYAQQIDANGNRLWTSDLRINRDLGTAAQFEPAAAVDAAGNLWVAWVDNRQGHNDIYAEHINSAGLHLWAEDKRVNRDANNADQGGVSLTTLPEQGAVIAWHDNRGGDYDIYAEFLTNEGTASWAENLQLSRDAPASAQTYPTIAAEGAGAFSVAWLDQRVGNSDLYAQRVAINGQLLWNREARINQPAEAAQSRPRLAINSARERWLGWVAAQDGRLLLQMLNENGQAPTSTAVALSRGHEPVDPNQPPALMAASDDSLVAAWVASSDGQVYAQRFYRSTGVAWSQAVRLHYPTTTPRLVRSSVALTPTRQRFIIGVWSEQQPTNPGEVFTQALDQAGRQQWPQDQLINDRSGKVDQQLVAVTTVANGETVLAWQDWRSGTPGLFVQRLAATGEHLWSEQRTASAISTTVGQLVPGLTAVGNDTVIAWSDNRTGSARLYAQRFDQRGNRQWPTDQPIDHPTDAAVAQLNPAVTSDQQGRVYVVWQQVSDNQQRLLIQQVDRQGATVWSKPTLLPTGTTPILPALAAGPAHDLYLAWLEKSADGANVFAQRVSADGAMLWPQMAQANRTTDEVNTLNPPALGVDAAGNATVVWVDREDAAVKVQQLNPSGQPQWPADVLVNSKAAGFAPLPDLAVSPTGQSVIVWQQLFEKRYTIAAQQVAASGALLWPEVIISREANAAQRPQISLDAANNALVTWQERRFNNWDIAAQRLAPTGELIWPYDQRLVPQEHFYFSTGMVESAVVDESATDILGALVSVTLIRNGGSFAIWLSNDGGTHWEAVQPGLLHTFASKGSNLRWKLALQGDLNNLTQTPTVVGITIDYTLVAAATTDPYEADDDCSSAWPLQVDGLAQTHQLTAGLPGGDSDWLRLTVPQTGPVTLIAQGNPLTATFLMRLYNEDCLRIAETATRLGVAQLTISATAQSKLFVETRPAADDMPPVFYTLGAYQRPSGQRAVLVAAAPVTTGGVAEQIQQVADRAYRTLRRHGYGAASIYFLNSTPTHDADGDGNNDVDALFSAAGLQAALEEWPLTFTNEPATALALFVVGVGQAGYLQTAANEQISVEQLDLWLANATLQSDADEVTVLLDVNQAGRWIAPSGPSSLPTLARRSRTILAATDQTGGVWQTPTGVLFSDIVWTLLDQGASLRESSAQAQALIAQIDYRCAGIATPCQQPWLDDNGDGQANQPTDGALAQAWRLPPAASAPTPIIQAVTVQPQATAGDYAVEATLLHTTAPTTVLAEIHPLTATVPLPSTGLPLAANFPVIQLHSSDVPPPNSDRTTSIHYRALLTGLAVPAEYRLVIFAQTGDEMAALPKVIHLRTGAILYLPLVANRQPLEAAKE